MRTITTKTLLSTLALTLVLLAVQLSSALAAQPWWGLTVDTAPATIQPGLAKDEVQEITVSATGGTFELRGGSGKQDFAWDATHQELQEGLEAMYGKDNVEVPARQGNETGSDPYRIIWKGELTDTSVKKFVVTTELEGRQEVVVRELVKGRSDGTVVLTAANLGNADLQGPLTMAAKLPAGLTPVSIDGIAGFADTQQLPCSKATLSCVYQGVTKPYNQAQLIIPVNVNPGARSGELAEISVTGGNVAPSKASRPVPIGDVPASYGIENDQILPEEFGGAVATQAGSHPFQLTTTSMLSEPFYENAGGSSMRPETTEMPKDLVFKLPPGLIGNPTPFPQCPISAFDNRENNVNECPNNTAIGVASVTVALPGGRVETQAVPLFNLVPSSGEPAKFGFLAFSTPVFLDASVRTGGDYGVTVTVPNISQTVTFVASRVSFWGVPGDSRHDSQRGWSCIEDKHYEGFTTYVPPCSPTDQQSPPPLIELPTSCTGTLETSIESDSWEKEGVFVPTMGTGLPALDGCNQLPFNPSISVAPDGQAGSTPSGLDVEIHVPQTVSLDAEGLGEADVKDTTVTLPAGVALNPSAADGLQSCSESQAGLQLDLEVGCPESSKVATLEIKSPLLPNPLTGAAYLAQQNTNPFGSLVALYLVAQDPVSGTLIKLAGEVKLDPVTGQLVSTFLNTPQLPFEDFRLHFFGGDRAPLATPAFCGAYTTRANISPWSGNAPSEPSSTFDVATGPNGSGCPDGSMPFHPSLTAGTTSIQAGGFSPFTMTVNRQDGEQSIRQLVLHMPQGLSGLLTGVELCGEAQANAGTCGANSLIGETTVSVGVGGDPYSVTGGKVYITGPYNGAPFGISVVVPANAGPYDLGVVVVRGRIEVNPVTSALTISTDASGQHAIPHILDGIPLEIKHVNFTTTRPGFTFNPTNCEPMSISGNITSAEGSSSQVAVPFQATNCATLAFKPGFKVSTNGKTSRKNGASLTVKLTYPKAPFGTQANVKSVKVDLPKQLPSRLTTLQKACTSSQFEANPGGCPAASIVGHATAITPLIPVPLTGPAYFVSYGGAKFPELVVVLQGYGVTLDLHGETFINKAGITSSTFKTVPDAPVGSFELTLPQSSDSALAANGNLCQAKLQMPTRFVAQNGMTLKQNTPIGVTGCAKHKAKTKKKAGKSHRKGK